MKIIQKLILPAFIFVTIAGFAQSKQPKYTELEFRVEGVCGMCETRIERALDQKGIKLADWNLETKQCRVVYKTELYTELEIHQLIADVGHSTSKVKATKEAYDNLHSCCKY